MVNSVAYMGVEHGKPQQFFSPDNGGKTGRRRTSREEEQLRQAEKEMKTLTPLNIFSREPKVDPSSPVTKPTSKGLKEIFSQLMSRRQKSNKK